MHNQMLDRVPQSFLSVNPRQEARVGFEHFAPACGSAPRSRQQFNRTEQLRHDDILEAIRLCIRFSVKIPVHNLYQSQNESEMFAAIRI